MNQSDEFVCTIVYTWYGININALSSKSKNFNFFFKIIMIENRKNLEDLFLTKSFLFLASNLKMNNCKE